MLKSQTIVLIGGPGTGKTTLLNHLENNGHFCLPEISREVIIKAQQEGIDQLFLDNPLLFSEMLLEGRINQHKIAKNKDSHVFIDRGIPDVVAYMDYIGSNYPKKFIDACTIYNYDKIFYLPPWEEIYQSDNERYESFQQAVEISQHLVLTYQKFGYSIIEIPFDTIENRFNFIMNSI